MNHPIKKLKGIGEKRESELNAAKIFTVGDILASRDPGVTKWKAAAHEYVKQNQNQKGDESKTGREPLTPRREVDAPECADDGGSATRFLLKDHTWINMRIQMPVQADSGLYVMQDMIVYELCLDPSYRIAVLCDWIKDQYHSCSRSFSPQMIAHFNPTLPVLKTQLRQDDVAKLQIKYPNAMVLFNVLEETNLILGSHVH